MIRVARDRLALKILMLVVMGLAAACTSGAAAAPSVASLASGDPAEPSPSSSAAAGADPEEAFLAFAECMRENGIDMPDPQFDRGPGGEGRVFSIGGDGVDFESEEFEAAEEACQHHLEGMQREISPEQRAEMQEQLVAFAQCMREHGIDMPDPQIAGGDGPVRIGGPAGADPGFDPESPEFQAAQEACADELGELSGPRTDDGSETE